MGAERLRAMVISAVMAALALTLPPAFHAVGLGSKFLPMLLPLLLNGAGTGLLIPWVSAFATGMPPLYPPVAAVVSAEAAVMAGLAASLYRGGGRSLWVALGPAVIAGRLVAFSLVIAGRLVAFSLTWILARAFGLPPAVSAVAATVEGLPGVALQLAVVPAVLHVVSRRPGLLLQDKS